jgi:hypothetical protein
MPDDERTTHWYYRVAGHETGPVLFSRLRQLARQGEIFAEDKVRKGKMGEWIEAATVDALGARPRSKPATKGGNAPKSSADSEPPAGLGEAGSFPWLSVKDWFYDAIQGVVERGWLIRRAASVIALAVVIVVLARLMLSLDWDSFGRPAADPYATFHALGDDLRQKREAKASDEAWKEFSERGRREIGPIVAVLEKKAGATNRKAQLLLWAGRDCLPYMFDDAREKPSASERLFDEYMQNVRLLDEQKPIYGGGRGAIRTRGQLPTIRPWYDVDLETAALWGTMILVDVGIVFWLIRAWLIRARMKR